LIISNLALDLLISIYFILDFFLILSFKIWFNLIFISNLYNPHSFDCLLFSYPFFNWIFYLSNLVHILLNVICFSLIIFLIEISYLSDLVPIILIAIYFIWNNLWNCEFFSNFIIFQLFYLSDLISIILLVIYLIWNNLWIRFFFLQFHHLSIIFHNTTKHRKIIHFSRIHFSRIHFPKKCTSSKQTRS
jgi:hypothetical protein